MRVRNLGWIAVGVAFTAFVFLMYEHGWFGATLVEPSTQPGVDAATMYATAYVLEYAIAFDHVFVIALVLQGLRIPEEAQRRWLRWALCGAIVVRVLVLTAAADLAQSFQGASYLFGGYLAYQGARLMLPDEIGGEREDGLVERVLRRFGGITIASIVLVELAFTFDSIASLSITRTAFIVVTSNVMATLGLRSLYGTLVRQPLRFEAVRPFTAILLAFAGITLLAREYVVIPHVVALVFTVGVVGVGLVTARLPRER